MSKKKENGIVRKQNTAPAGRHEVDEMFGGGPVQLPVDAPLPQIAILRESAQFEMPDGQFVKEFCGHILYWHNANQYYAAAYGEAENPLPDCFSPDGIAPEGGQFKQDGPCRTCPLNKFGSAADGVAKACQNTIRMYVLVEGEVIPCLLKAPPSSLGRKDSLMRWLTSAPNIAAKAGMGTKYQPILAKFALRKKEFSSGMTASVIEIQTVRTLEREKDAGKLKQLAALYNEFMAHYIGRVKDDIGREKNTQTA